MTRCTRLPDFAFRSRRFAERRLAHDSVPRDNVWTRAARLRSGDRIKVHLFSWDDYSSQYEKFNRSELDDASLQLQGPTWGELMD